MNLLSEIENRYSVRDFLGKSVEEDKLLRILEAGRRAPSAKNRQPWRFIVSQEERQRKKFEEAAYGQEYVGAAPCIISICTTNVDYKMPNGELAHPIDLSFAVSFMMVQAQAEGLGTCVVTTFREADVRELLTVPYSMKVIMLLLLGYPGGEGVKGERKKLDQIVSFEHW
ncbi:MAG: nitroreductase family protein [Spirochaetales bacterium]|nr:nitroreductase family protein [Spirochaetales bacterium]